jgi:hypothetical protein
MSRLEVPVVGQILFSTGDVKLRIEIDLLLRNAAGGWHQDTFRVDSATEITTFPACDAKHYPLPIPQSATAGAAHAQTGLAVRSGFLRFRIHGMDQTEYAVPTLFLGDPDTPPDARQPATFPRKLLQPLALLDWLRFTAEKNPVRGNLYGELVVEKV